MSVTAIRLQDRIFIAERPLGTAMTVKAALILGERYAVVVDTLQAPADMGPFRALISGHGRPAVVVNTHWHWDHVWGNDAFSEALLIGHDYCREEMLAALPPELERKQNEQRSVFDAVRIVPPAFTFSHTASIHAGGLTVELHYLPGHTRDSCVAYIPERGLLLAGDCAESPIPASGEGASLASWARALRAWATQAQTVVPAHGPISGPELLQTNAAYLEGLLADPDHPWESAIPFYQETHRANVEVARAERARAAEPGR
jgi:glyoxylase-like metal-dependent hydrolase (beta-lactamase superfamily II)